MKINKSSDYTSNYNFWVLATRDASGAKMRVKHANDYERLR